MKEEMGVIPFSRSPPDSDRQVPQRAGSLEERAGPRTAGKSSAVRARPARFSPRSTRSRPTTVGSKATCAQVALAWLMSRRA